ncbi:Protein ENHANCED DISEASE RESISTANCE 4 [Linum perenne]
MATVAPKIRLVRCPRCSEVLTELSNVPVYQCGGCGTHLQAKPWALTSSASNLSASSNPSNLNRLLESGDVSEREDNSSSSSADSSAFSESGKSLVHLPNDAQLAGDDEQKSEACNQETQGEIKAVNGYTSGEIDDCKFSNQQQLPGCCTDKQQEVSKEASLSTQATFLEKEGTSPDVGVASQAESNGDRPLGGRGRLERDELQPQPRSCVNGYASGISYDQSQRGTHRNSDFHPRINTADIEWQKIRLLKLVQELRDQLTGSCSLEDKVSGRVSAEDTRRDQHAPRFLYGEALEKSKYRIDPRSYSGENRRAQQRQHSRIPFSAEATYSRHKVHQCFCCHARCQKCHAQCLFNNSVFCGTHSGTTFCSSYGPCSAIPRRHMASEYSIYGGTAKCNDQRHRGYHDLKNYSMETHHLVNKRQHLTSLAGGSPSLACPRCSKQLQLPADFQVCNRIRCSACSEILKLSLVNSTHLVPSATILDSHLADVVSCSESYSTEADHAPSSSGSSKHCVQRKRTISDKLKSSGKQPVESKDSTDPYLYTVDRQGNDECTESGKVRGRGRSPLHRLMGYSSLSGALRGTGIS